MPEGRRDDSDPPGRPPRPTCGEQCSCPRASGASNDLDTLLAAPGFSGALLGSDAAAVAAHLPSLGHVVGVTVAGPVLMNDVGTHEPPVTVGGPIRCRASRISLRLNPARLGAALVTDPAADVPPTLRLFDAAGNTAHATYLTESSERLAFESLSFDASRFAASTVSPRLIKGTSVDTTAHRDDVASWATSFSGDQIAQFDAVLEDGGTQRLRSLPRARAQGFARVESRRVIAAFEHAALLGMPMTIATTAPGCVQIHHDRLDGAREHRGTMVIASGSCRAMINFDLVSECWVTWSDGVWGRTGSIELYDRRGHCSLLVTQTGSVSAEVFVAWHQLVSDVAG
ncbi:heme transporter [Gordonia sp. SID5947]|uniref:heme transporter n=1 Tax=Gordonia sp. SID5947 TaxID=2690315 RepID=UPI00136CA919|nr:heme transporter [Gordonia sp. SID5947]MYR06095.1 heme transporter [Gordonia sp. SID5947]